MLKKPPPAEGGPLEAPPEAPPEDPAEGAARGDNYAIIWLHFIQEKCRKRAVPKMYQVVLPRTRGP